MLKSVFAIIGVVSAFGFLLFVAAFTIAALEDAVKRRGGNGPK